MNFYNSSTMDRDRLVLVIIFTLAAASIILFTASLMNGDSGWTCVNGRWVPRGNPTMMAPLKPCSNNNNE